MPKFELNFSWETIGAVTHPDRGKETAHWIDFGTGRLLEQAAGSLGAPLPKAVEFCQFMPVWDDPSLRNIFRPGLDAVEAYVRELWLAFLAETPRTPPQLIVKDVDHRLPGVAPYFESLLLSLRPAPMALPHPVLEEQARRADWYRSPWAIGALGTFGIVAATGAFWLMPNSPAAQIRPVMPGARNAPISRTGERLAAPRISVNPPVEMKGAPSFPTPAFGHPERPGQDFASLMGKGGVTVSEAPVSIPHIPSNAPHSLPSMVAAMAPSTGMALPKVAPALRSMDSSRPEGNRRRTATPVRRSLFASMAGIEPLPSVYSIQSIKNGSSAVWGTDLSTLSANAAARKAASENKAVAGSPKMQLASVSGLSTGRLAPASFSMKPVGKAQLLTERSKPRPKRVPASLYQEADKERDLVASRTEISDEKIEGTKVGLNQLLDKLTSEMDCSYILQPGAKSDFTVRLEGGQPEETMSQVLKMVGLTFKVSGQTLYIGKEEWLDQVFPAAQASLVITEPTEKKMDDTVDVANKISEGKLEVKRVGKYSVVSGAPEQLQKLLKSETLPAEANVQALYASHVPAEGLIKQVPTSILAGNVMESFEDRSVRIQGSPVHVAAALNLLTDYDKKQSEDSSQLAMLRVRNKKVEEPAATTAQ